MPELGIERYIANQVVPHLVMEEGAVPEIQEGQVLNPLPVGGSSGVDAKHTRFRQSAEALAAQRILPKCVRSPMLQGHHWAWTRAVDMKANLLRNALKSSSLFDNKLPLLRCHHPHV